MECGRAAVEVRGPEWTRVPFARFGCSRGSQVALSCGLCRSGRLFRCLAGVGGGWEVRRGVAGEPGR
jgi:hypothetical protein